MLKTIILAGTMAALVTAAATIATANNSASIVSIDKSPAIVAMKDTNGIVDCTSQQWPHIDAMCLTAASDEGEVRQARLVNM